MDMPAAEISNIPEVGPDKFDTAAKFVFEGDGSGKFAGEGGYLNDNGKPTMYGVTQAVLNAYNSAQGKPMQNVKDIQVDYAREIARNEYFYKPKLDMLPDRVAVAALDYAFNSYHVQAIKDLQRAVGAKADGIMGPGTLKAVNDYIAKNGEDDLLDKYINRRSEFLGTLVKNHPHEYAKWANGWANRLAGLRTYLGSLNLQAQKQ